MEGGVCGGGEAGEGVVIAGGLYMGGSVFVLLENVGFASLARSLCCLLAVLEPFDTMGGYFYL